MASGEATAALVGGLASVAPALGNGRRAEIVDVLAQGERSVEPSRRREVGLSGGARGFDPRLPAERRRRDA